MEKTGDKNWQWYEAAATQWRGRGADRETQPELNAALDCARGFPFQVFPSFYPANIY